MHGGITTASRGENMGFFKRKASPVTSHPITGFWQWWAAEGRTAFSTAAATGEWGNLPHAMSKQLATIHPDLAWDTAQGQVSRHLLVVSSEGDAGLRRIAEQWLRAAPASDETWEYAAARQPQAGVLDNVLDINGRQLHLGEIRFELNPDPDRECLDIKVFHPAFVDMLDDEPLQVSFLVLDWILGEDGVERWVGTINAIPSGQAATATASDLREAINHMASQARTDRWVLLQGTTPAGERMLVNSRRPLRWIDHPLLDLHTQVRLTYENQREDGLPTPKALDRLRTIEDAVTAALGRRGILVAHETAAGERLLHYYSDSDDQNGRHAIETAARSAGAATQHVPDPGWTRVRQFS
ncbi:DUF695 domain-containing protein [Arthrobacter sp. BB-1]|nr:DUF695 domain-containing protein [Arthrobacter sp. BB-1]